MAKASDKPGSGRGVLLLRQQGCARRVAARAHSLLLMLINYQPMRAPLSAE